MRIPSPILVLTQLAAIALAPITAPVPAQPLPSAVVAYTGQIAPGTGGATYFLLYQPTITAVGDVAFRAEIAGAGVNGTNNKGYWRQSDGGPVGLFLRAGNPTPLPGTTWSTDVGSPTAQAVGGAARTGFYWGLLDGGPVKGALWSEQPGGVRAVAVQGDPAPGIPGATYQPGLPIFDTNFDEAGELLFRAAVTGGGATSANDEGLWIDDGTTTSLVVREGEPAPGFPAGTFFPGIQSPNARVAPGSGVTFWANPFVPVLALNQTGIWSNRTGGLTPVALQGNSAPGLGPGETIGPGLPFANRAGQIAFFSPIFGGAGGARSVDLRCRRHPGACLPRSGHRRSVSAPRFSVLSCRQRHLLRDQQYLRFGHSAPSDRGGRPLRLERGRARRRARRGLERWHRLQPLGSISRQRQRPGRLPRHDHRPWSHGSEQ